MGHVARGYFYRGEKPTMEQLEDVDVMVVPLECWRDDRGWLFNLKADSEIEILVHVPVAYIGVNYDGTLYTGVPYDGIVLTVPRMRTTTGETVKIRCGAHLLDLFGTSWRTLAFIYADFFAQAGDEIDGLFLDCVWDEVEWVDGAMKLSGYEDEDWAEAMRLFGVALRFHLGRRGVNLKLVANGWTNASRAYDALCYEDFPLMPKGQSGIWPGVMGDWGIKESGFPEYHVIPAGSGTPASCPQPQAFINAYAFLAAYAPGTSVLYSNNPYDWEMLWELV